MAAVLRRAAAIAILAGCTSSPSPPLDGPAPAVLIRLRPAGMVGLELGTTLRFEVEAVDRSGSVVPLATAATFRTTNEAVVSVTSAGAATAVSVGVAYVVATLATSTGSVSDSTEIAVACTLELRQQFDPPARTLSVGESFRPSVSYSTCGGRVAVTDSVTWSPLDTAVTSVDSTGLIVTGRSPGSTIVRAVGKRLGATGGIPVTVIRP